MKSTLPATHLLRQFLLFALTIVFLQTLIRAAYALWQFPRIEQTGAHVALFVQGLRFDMALVGIVCLVPIVVGSLLSMTSVTRVVARYLIVLFLFAGLLLVLLLELITPWFIQTQGLRPDLDLIQSIENPIPTLFTVVRQFMVPVAIGVVLSILILIAFWARMELSRFLRFRVSAPSATILAIGGGLLCILAIWSNPDLRQPALSPGDALISTDATVNELSLNTTYKTLFSVARPLFNR